MFGGVAPAVLPDRRALAPEKEHGHCARPPGRGDVGAGFPEWGSQHGFDNPTPILFDEWQETPEIWNLTRRAVDVAAGGTAPGAAYGFGPFAFGVFGSASHSCQEAE